MLDASVAFLWPEAFARQTTMDSSNEPQAYTRDITFVCSDGTYIVAAANSQDEWEGLCRALDHPEWIEDPNFLTGALRSKNVQLRYETVDDAVGGFDQQEVVARLQREDVPCS